LHISYAPQSLLKQQLKLVSIYPTIIIYTQANAQGYDPKRSRVNDDTMMDFIREYILYIIL